MTLRRYLASVYDWTGIASLINQSKVWHIGSLSFVAVFVLLLDRSVSSLRGENAVFRFYLHLHGPGAHVSHDDLFHARGHPVPLLYPADQCLSHVLDYRPPEGNHPVTPFPMACRSQDIFCSTFLLTKKWPNARPRRADGPNTFSSASDAW